MPGVYIKDIEKNKFVKLTAIKGDTGKSAYEIWLQEGNTGTEKDFLDSLKSSNVTFDYNNLENQPCINNIQLIGNKTLDDLGIQAKGNYALQSDIPDVSNFITKDITELTNYYDKDDINSLVGDIETVLGGI